MGGFALVVERTGGMKTGESNQWRKTVEKTA